MLLVTLNDWQRLTTTMADTLKLATMFQASNDRLQTPQQAAVRLIFLQAEGTHL
jgi:hypothetical protein